ncbi:MAG: hypothetical protein PEPC_01820 [Peptostreptococcus russellii]
MFFLEKDIDMKLNIKDIILLSIIIVFSACSNNENFDNHSIFGKYLLYEISSQKSVDINNDNKENVNLLEEIESLENSAIYLYEGVKPGYSSDIDLLWPEACFNESDLLVGFPNNYTENMNIKYLSVSIQYYVSIDYSKNTITTENKKNIDNSIYTLDFPDYFEFNPVNKIIVMSTTQRFLTKDGIITVPFIAKFKYESTL